MHIMYSETTESPEKWSQNRQEPVQNQNFWQSKQYNGAVVTITADKRKLVENWQRIGFLKNQTWGRPR